MFVTAGAHTSEAESRMVKAVIDGITTESTTLVSVASDTENKARKTRRLIVGKKIVSVVSLTSFTWLSMIS